MNLEHKGWNKLSFFRKLVFGLSGILFILIITGIDGSIFIIAGLIITLFLAVTNFGRQCPLLLSLRYHINRMKTKNNKSNTQE